MLLKALWIIICRAFLYFVEQSSALDAQSVRRHAGDLTFRRVKMSEQDYMRRAIELARKGEGWCHPNPMVGAVIVKDGRIIGEGYHARCGELHAERNAIASLRESARGATIYVTLEPCCHYGRTPPCTEAIIEQKIARVVIGSRDPNPRVSGGGAKVLREAGIEVVEDFLREECDALNPVFFHYITTKTPYVIMKYAMTADGKIATKTGASKWITGEAARGRVQQMRHACMGIMAGIGTVLADDPMLNCRIEGGRDPVRIICDSSLKIPADSAICRTAKDIPTIVVSAFADLPDGEISTAENGNADAASSVQEKIQTLQKCGIRVLNVPDRNHPGGTRPENSRPDLRRLIQLLGGMEIDSILLEGGGTLNESALQAGIVQEVRAFIAPKLFGGQAKTPVEGSGISVPDEAVQMSVTGVEQIGADLMVSFRVENGSKSQ